MHQNKWDSSKYLIELSQISYDPTEFFNSVQGYEFQDYVSAYGKKTPMQVCYDDNLINESIIQHYLNVFKDFNISVNAPSVNHQHGTGLNGWSLIKSNMNDQPLACHIDAQRSACITFPLSFPQTLNLHESKNSEILHVYEYKPVIVILNSGSKWHSVSKAIDTRWQFQFDCYNTWDEIQELVKLNF